MPRAGQDALLPLTAALGQGEQLCSAPSPAVMLLLVPALYVGALCQPWGPAAGSGAKDRGPERACSTASSSWALLDAHTRNPWPVPAPDPAVPQDAAPALPPRAPGSGRSTWEQGRERCWGSGGPCAPPGEPNGGERWWEGTGGLSTLWGGTGFTHV